MKPTRTPKPAAKRKDAREALRDRLVERLVNMDDDDLQSIERLCADMRFYWRVTDGPERRDAARRIADLLAGSEGQ